MKVGLRQVHFLGEINSIFKVHGQTIVQIHSPNPYSKPWSNAPMRGTSFIRDILQKSITNIYAYLNEQSSHQERASLKIQEEHSSCSQDSSKSQVL